MCELKVILDRGGELELVMESVTRMVVDGDSIELTGIFGDRINVSGSIKEVDFTKGETLILGK
ncbi:MAG TPA: CooT family nickel-binding protein [Methanosarcinaceae archaeon]|nr:CooT family nickel-binding protein [Methanosarcinaceae archaeon]